MSLGYNPSILAHTHQIPVNSAQTQHVLTVSEQSISSTSELGRKRKVILYLA